LAELFQFAIPMFVIYSLSRLLKKQQVII